LEAYLTEPPLLVGQKKLLFPKVLLENFQVGLVGLGTWVLELTKLFLNPFSYLNLFS
jgi:hypothetical protein